MSNANMTEAQIREALAQGQPASAKATVEHLLHLLDAERAVTAALREYAEIQRTSYEFVRYDLSPLPLTQCEQIARDEVAAIEQAARDRHAAEEADRLHEMSQ